MSGRRKKGSWSGKRTTKWKRRGEVGEEKGLEKEEEERRGEVGEGRWGRGGLHLLSA